MAFKVLILARKRADLSWDAFVAAYEKHCDWTKERIDAGILSRQLDYRRNYILPGHRLQTPSAAQLDFDVVVEVWFEDEAGLDANHRLSADPAFVTEVFEELSQYLDMESIRYVPVMELQKKGQSPTEFGQGWSG